MKYTQQILKLNKKNEKLFNTNKSHLSEENIILPGKEVYENILNLICHYEIAD